MEVNLAAADEIARQLRLRDMGGIIVVDFIDIHDNANKQKLFEHMTKAMACDRAKHNILPLSKFCLMQITRQRVRPAMDVETSETCPACYGSGTVKPSILFTDSLEGKIDCLKCMIRLCRDNGIKLIFAYSPYYHVLPAGGVIKVMEIAKEESVSFLDMMLDEDFDNPELFRDIMHLNDAGVQLCYSKIVELLNGNLCMEM